MIDVTLFPAWTLRNIELGETVKVGGGGGKTLTPTTVVIVSVPLVAEIVTR